MKTPASMTDAEMAEAYLRVEEIEKFCVDLRHEALQRALTGSVLPGLKVVTGREGNRNWADAKAIAGALPLLIGDSAYKPREVISPTDAERLLGKAQPAEWDSLQQFITRAPGQPKLVRQTDARPAIGAIALEFPVMS
jgi:hypothetical protein